MRKLLLPLAALLLAFELSPAPARADDAPIHHPPKARHGGTVVQLCDGETSTEIARLAPGERLSRDDAQRVADGLMARWRQKHPDALWGERRGEAQGGSLGGTAEAPSKPEPSQAGIYVGQDARDAFIQKEAVEAAVRHGSEIFHSDKLLGGTVGMSCDMCHPNA
ncbi:MAG: hypothetical protein ACYCWW_15740, partial [Deltaproteobacteria bacterium]